MRKYIQVILITTIPLCIAVFIIFFINPEFLFYFTNFENLITTGILLLSIYSIPVFLTGWYSTHLNKTANLIEDPKKISDLYYGSRFAPESVLQVLQKIGDYQSNLASDHFKLAGDKKLFTAILENMKDGIIIANAIGQVTLINKAARTIFNLGNREILGGSLAEVLRNHKINELWEKCIVSLQQEMTTFESASTKSFIQCIAAPLSPEIPGSILLLFQDLTRMRRLEIIRRDFVSNVSHELRTPLASLKLIAETLQEGALQDPPAAKRFLQQMDGEVDNLTQLVEELLELSRIESGQVPLEKKWVYPHILIEEAGKRMLMQAERAGLDYSYSCEETLPAIFIDHARLSQVFINLLHNAIKFTPPGGKVTLSAYKQDESIVFYVKDSGVGILPKDLARIFERFYKSDPSRSKRGTGLGLSISKHLVEIHGGKIWAESSPNNGSRFLFAIPINKSN